MVILTILMGSNFLYGIIQLTGIQYAGKNFAFESVLTELAE